MAKDPLDEKIIASLIDGGIQPDVEPTAEVSNVIPFPKTSKRPAKAGNNEPPDDIPTVLRGLADQVENGDMPAHAFVVGFWIADDENKKDLFPYMSMGMDRLQALGMLAQLLAKV